MEEIAENAHALMRSPVYLVVYCDPQMYPILKDLRQDYAHITVFHVMNVRELWTYQYEGRVIENREVFWGSRDPRAGSDSHLITCAKPDLVLKTIDANPFKTSRFGWVDCFLRRDMKKIAQNWTPNMLPLAVSDVTDKFKIQILNVTDKRFKLAEHKKEMYGQYRYIVCGCLFTCGADVGRKVLTRLKEIFVQTTLAGFGHGEEMLFLEILDEFYDDIDRSYGDYGQILNNFAAPRENINYVVSHILNRYADFRYYREGYDLGNTLLKEIRGHRLHVDPHLHVKILFQCFACTYYYRKEEARALAEHILDVCRNFPPIRRVVQQNPHFYKAQLAYVLPIPDDW